MNQGRKVDIMNVISEQKVIKMHLVMTIQFFFTIPVRLKLVNYLIITWGYSWNFNCLENSKHNFVYKYISTIDYSFYQVLDKYSMK